MCEELSRLVISGDLFSARRLALTASTASANPFSPPKHTVDDATAAACSAEWLPAVDELLLRDNFELAVDAAHRERYPTPQHARAGVSASICFTGDEKSGWERCCTSLRLQGSADCFRADPGLRSTCCAFANATRSFLRIPAVREIWVSLRLVSGRLVHIEQDGFLRPFDMATVLWPAGYLLAQWASDPRNCNAWRGGRVLELGAGTGAASIAAAHCGAGRVLATDGALRSLALTRANGALNGVEVGRLQTMRFEWESDSELQAVLQAGPYVAVLGAALQFEKWADRMWQVLRALTDSSPGATIALVHTAGSLGKASDDFDEERVPGLHYGMHTAWRGDESDYEVVVLRRRSRAGKVGGAGDEECATS
jgi:predicted RNA methylase